MKNYLTNLTNHGMHATMFTVLLRDSRTVASGEVSWSTFLLEKFGFLLFSTRVLFRVALEIIYLNEPETTTYVFHR